MQGKTVGLVTDSVTSSISVSDQYIVPYLESYGYSTVAAPWDSKTVEWNTFDYLILRSCWNYHHKLLEFFSWIEDREKKTHIWNPLSTVRWNSNKRYLLELEQQRIQIVPSTILKKNSSTTLSELFTETGYDQIVIKPCSGASGFNVIKITKNDYLQKEKLFSNILKEIDIIVQPLMKEIHKGELSFVFIGKKYSHTILKLPKYNDFRTNYDFGGTQQLYAVDEQYIKQAQRIVNEVPDPLLYARVDGIIVNGKFVLMELELIEPYLFFDLYPQAAKSFAERFIELQ